MSRLRHPNHPVRCRPRLPRASRCRSYQNGEKLKRHNRTWLGGVLYLILTLLFVPITMFMIADEIDKVYTAAGKQSSVSALTVSDFCCRSSATSSGT